MYCRKCSRKENVYNCIKRYRFVGASIAVLIGRVSVKECILLRIKQII